MTVIRMHCGMLWAPGVTKMAGSRSCVHFMRVGVAALTGEAGGWIRGLARRARSKVDVSVNILVWLPHLQQAMSGVLTGKGRVRRSCSRSEHLSFEQVISTIQA